MVVTYMSCMANEWKCMYNIMYKQHKIYQILANMNYSKQQSIQLTFYMSCASWHIGQPYTFYLPLKNCIYVYICIIYLIEGKYDTLARAW